MRAIVIVAAAAPVSDPFELYDATVSYLYARCDAVVGIHREEAAVDEIEIPRAVT